MSENQIADSDRKITAKHELVFPEPVEVPTYGADGASSGSKTFTAGGVRNYPNIAVLKEAVRRYQGHLRRGTASTKLRGEIRGTNAKPWRQKGTGRARAGTKKSPLWRGGGVTFGPKPRTYDYGLPKKQRRLATRHAMLSKILDSESHVLEGLSFDKPSAKTMASVLNKIGIKGSCLIAVSSDMPKEARVALVHSCANLPKVQVLSVSDFNALALLKHRSLVLMADAFDEVQGNEDALRSAQGVGGAA